MLVKDEQDIVEETVRHLLGEGVDYLYVLDNLSTDGTAEILQRLRDDKLPLTVDLDEQVGYYQSTKTTALAQRALADGFDWVIPCDADEWWCSVFGSLRDVIEGHDDAGFDIIKAELYDHVPTGDDDVDELNPYKRIEWRFGYPGRLGKVACRCRPDLTIGMGNHSARYEHSLSNVRYDAALSLHHFTWRSEDQYVRKIRNGWVAYAHTDLPPETGGHWRMFGPPDEPTWEERVRAHYRTWFYVGDPVESRPDLKLVHDPVWPQ